MDEPLTQSATSNSNGGQQQEYGKSSWPAFMTVKDFLADAPYGNMKATRKAQLFLSS
jgi:hypothetical protein